MAVLHKSKKTLIILVACSILLLLASWWTYWLLNINYFNRQNFAPNTYINGQLVSKKSVQEISKTHNDYLKNHKVTITLNNNNSSDISAISLGVSINDTKLNDIASKSRKKASLYPWPTKQDYIFAYDIDNQALAASGELLTVANPDKPINAKFFIDESGKVAISDSKKGIGINTEDLLSQLKSETGWILPSKISVQTKNVEPRVGKSQLEILLPEANRILALKMSLIDNGKNIDIDKSKVISFYEPIFANGQNVLQPNKVLVSTFINELLASMAQQPKDYITYVYKSGKPNTTSSPGENGSQVANTEDLTKQFYQSLSNKNDFTGQISRSPIAFKSVSQFVDDTLIKRTFSYSVTTWGTVASDINNFKTLVSETLNDSRGWRKANVAFTEVASGGDFTIVLAEPATLPANYPNTCDSTYSCQVGRFVMINDERWRNATSVWTGSLRDYRHMVTNHETGHWLGQPHQFCQSAGQPAPVMQQQSINLQGCTFNPWPLDWEAQKVSNRY